MRFLFLWHCGVFPCGSLRLFVSVAFAGLEVWSVSGRMASGVISQKGPVPPLFWVWDVKRTQILQVNPWKNLHLVPRFSTTRYSPSCIAQKIYPRIQHYSTTHKTEYWWWDLFINTPLHKLFSTILKRFWIGKTWWWPLPAETRSFIVNRI